MSPLARLPAPGGPEATWWVRLGPTLQGPFSEEALVARQQADLFSRWHEVSRDQKTWVPLDERARLPRGMQADSDTPGHPGEMEAADAAGDDSFWQHLDSGASLGAPQALGGAGSAFPGVSTWAVAVASTAVLWLALWFVPLAWSEGQALRAWSWPIVNDGWGIVLAAWWWALGGVVFAACLADARWRRTAQSSFWRRGLLLWAGVGWLALVVGGPWPSRASAALVLLPLAAMLWVARDRRASPRRLGAAVATAAVACLLCLGGAWFAGPRLAASGPVVDNTAFAWAAAGRTHAVLAAVHLLTQAGLCVWALGPRAVAAAPAQGDAPLDPAADAPADAPDDAPFGAPPGAPFDAPLAPRHTLEPQPPAPSVGAPAQANPAGTP